MDPGYVLDGSCWSSLAAQHDLDARIAFDARELRASARQARKEGQGKGHMKVLRSVGDADRETQRERERERERLPLRIHAM